MESEREACPELLRCHQGACISLINSLTWRGESVLTGEVESSCCGVREPGDRVWKQPV